MTVSTIPRALAGVALSTLVLAATLPAPAQTLPSAATTPAPAATPLATPVPTGSRPIDARGLPSLAPADQAAPLPYPAYGTPAPASPQRTVPGVPQVITLQQAILIAYARAPQLASARADVAIASAPVLSARSALLPSVAGTASSTRTHRELSGNTGTTSAGGTSTGTTQVATSDPNATNNALSLQIRQLIFDGGRVAAQIREAHDVQQASLDAYQRALQTVSFNTATAYYNALNAERQTQVALETVRLDQVQENLVSAQIRAGTTARADLSTAQLATAQARVAVIRSQATAQQQLATFANTLGLDADTSVQPKDDVPALSATGGQLTIAPAFPTPDYASAVSRAYALRPDIAAQQAQISSDEQALRAAKLGMFPTLSGNAGYTTASADPNGGTFRNNSSVGVSLNVPIFDQGLTKAQVAQAQGQLDKANAQLQIVRQGVQLNVKQTLVNLISAYAALTQSNAELAKAQEVLRSTQAQYRAGVTTLPLLLNAQVGITQALTDEVTSVYAVRQAEQALLYAEGANAAG